MILAHPCAVLQSQLRHQQQQQHPISAYYSSSARGSVGIGFHLMPTSPAATLRPLHSMYV